MLSLRGDWARPETIRPEPGHHHGEDASLVGNAVSAGSSRTRLMRSVATMTESIAEVVDVAHLAATAGDAGHFALDQRLPHLVFIRAFGEIGEPCRVSSGLRHQSAYTTYAEGDVTRRLTACGSPVGPEIISRPYVRTIHADCERSHNRRRRRTLRGAGSRSRSRAYNIAPDAAGPRAPCCGDGPPLSSNYAGAWCRSGPTTSRIGSRLLNARSDGIATKPAFRAALKRRRCLILADGFYEWRVEGKTKLPFHIPPPAIIRPFAFAGLWGRQDRGDDRGRVVHDHHDRRERLHEAAPRSNAGDSRCEGLRAAASRPRRRIRPGRQAMRPAGERRIRAMTVSPKVNNAPVRGSGVSEAGVTWRQFSTCDFSAVD